jgi:hypothetical protein
MPLPQVDLTEETKPTSDGEINEYSNKEALNTRWFDKNRRVIFINGMNNSGEDHAKSALLLSLVQMCPVIGVYNKSVSGWVDFTQCIGDKIQFNGPFSRSASSRVGLQAMANGGVSVDAAREVLSRNPAQVKLFDLLREPKNRRWEVFAHSQGNLILSNALQAIGAVDGPRGLAGRVIHTFGSPAVNWPRGITKYEHAFTWDPVTFLAGFDKSWTISKVGMPETSWNPITHSFLEYLAVDPAFVVNRYRVGSFGATFSMDEAGLADALAAMGGNLSRVRKIFEHLRANHNSDIDDVAVLYVDRVSRSGGLSAVKSDRALTELLVSVMEGGYTGGDERKAINALRAP